VWISPLFESVVENVQTLLFAGIFSSSVLFERVISIGSLLGGTTFTTLLT
jgi:hypothetical protein